LEDVGAALASITRAGDVVLLRGDLGAGKTTLTRGLVRAKCGDESMVVTSPSYLLDNTYKYDEDEDDDDNDDDDESLEVKGETGGNRRKRGEGVLHHMDLYRLPTGSDLSMLDVPAIYKEAICVIEWPQRIGPKYMPLDYLDVNITIQTHTHTTSHSRDEHLGSSSSSSSSSSSDVKEQEEKEKRKEEEEEEEEEQGGDERQGGQTRIVTLTPSSSRWTSLLKRGFDLL